MMGILIIIKIAPVDNGKNRLRIMDTPVMPPGTKSFGDKNKLVPAPYRAATIVMIIYFFIFRLILLLIFIPVILKLSV